MNKSLEKSISELEKIRTRLIDITRGEIVNVGLLAYMLDKTIENMGGLSQGLKPVDYFVNEEI